MVRFIIKRCSNCAGFRKKIGQNKTRGSDSFWVQVGQKLRIKNKGHTSNADLQDGDLCSHSSRSHLVFERQALRFIL